MQRIRTAILFMAVISALPVAARAACDINGPAMLDLYLTGREAGSTVRAAIVRGASSQRVSDVVTLDAAVGALNAEIWGLYWLSLYSRRLHEVLEQVDEGRQLPPTSLSTGTVRGYYTRWDASQLSSSAAMTLRTAAEVATALARVEPQGSAAATAALLPEEAAKLRQYAVRVSTELQACAATR